MSDRRRPGRYRSNSRSEPRRGSGRSRSRGGARSSRDCRGARSRSRSPEAPSRSRYSPQRRSSPERDTREERRRRRGWEEPSGPAPTPAGPPAAASQAPATTSSAPPARVRIQSFEEILAQVRSGAMPSIMPARAGSAFQSGGGASGSFALPARSLYEAGYKGLTAGTSSEDCPNATHEELERARHQARIEEQQGRDEAKRAGAAPTGPPGLPTGCVVIEQKFVDFLLGPGGQSLAAINHAAGVNVVLDQSNKFSGWSVANIYGPQDKSEHAKLAIDFKISQWLPRDVRMRSGGAVSISQLQPGSITSVGAHRSDPPPPPPPAITDRGYSSSGGPFGRIEDRPYGSSDMFRPSAPRVTGGLL
eukprot:TRINITY_DN51382_c0_g1_i1.p1 TRINITY_DN51382_c0_g1~~TRINITY_DN51382_c0_g1_i1.p1  ORF type:complete len:362 (-),score=19.40 TRINITY_DN51382_c0_g1_i1:22-1107(-)